MSADEVELEIVRLGAEGDGIAQTPEGPLFVPFTLPGERVRAAIAGDRGTPTVLLRESAERVSPVCRHFRSCGGCVAQHMSEGQIARWRRETIAEAFRHRGLDVEIGPLFTVPLGSRRRAFLGVERHGDQVTIGFREEGRHTLVDMAECPVLAREIVAALPRLREMALITMRDGEGGRLLVTRLDSGLDVSFDNGRKGLSPEALARLAALAEAAHFVRLTVAGEPVAERAPPRLTIGGVAVSYAQGLFVQAAAEAEQRLVELVVAALPPKAKRVGDLFSGAGTFTFPLARHVEVSAFDGDKRAIATLTEALRHAQGVKPVAARQRDLYREPLSRKELNAFDMVVLDPPRAGAKAQAEALARSEVPVVVAVSCNAATLARDARILVDGGFAMGPVTPIDQFLYSAHIEAVVTFHRQRASRRAT
jgi:23S rRNA (uracil1939-C5)-methyltransferase